ncbi:type II toxin-antitoxin system RelE/ParE family toxin [Pseudomonas sp. GCM10022186]|uniref:type II toxin-antitoxin system RelE/ParE family toxin n=1 Tax=Pseudomonas sp. GCM10022186 TaxID=3252650 RepID=UPI0036228C4E
MSKTTEVAYASTAEESLISQVHHLTPHVGPDQAQSTLIKLVRDVEGRLKAHPLAAPICEEAALLGVSHYRELHIREYRILYRFHEPEALVVIALFLRQRQSIEEQLINYCLMR